MRKIVLFFFICILYILPWNAYANTQSKQFEYWNASVFQTGNNTLCELFTANKNNTIFLSVDTQPNSAVVNEWAILFHIPFKQDSVISLIIDEGTDRFFFKTYNGFALLRNSADSAKLITALQTGQTILIKGISKYNQSIQVELYTAGFIYAYNEINRLCVKAG